MLLAGDEICRTQRGNNNAYCQDNEISWIDWHLTEPKQKLLAFVQRLVALRREHPVFRRRHFFQGRPIHGTGVKDILWLNPDGREMTEEEWNQHHARCLGVYLAGEGLTETDERGRPITDANFLVLFNAHHEEIPFTLPRLAGGPRWLSVLDTAYEEGLAWDGVYMAGTAYPLQGRSLVLLQQQTVSP